MADGPYPKRSSQVVRRNKPETPIDTITQIGPVVVPDLALPNPHHLVTSLYESMKNSGQARFFEPSDWEYARLTMHFLDDLLKDPRRRGSAQQLLTINQMLTSLLLTEGDRRRVRLEIERSPEAPDGAQVLTMADYFKNQLTAGQNTT